MALHPFDERRLYHLDLCSGSGMLGLGLRCALGQRMRTIAYVEREARAAALLVERMEEKVLDSAPLWDDVDGCTSPQFVDYVRRFDPLLVSAGYPCQPFSNAGKREGERDERHLWPSLIEFARLVRPRYLFLENVQGHLTLGFDTVVADLQSAGYDIAAGLFTAAEVGASHERKRLFALAVLGDPASGHAGLPDGRSRNEKRGDAAPGAVETGKPGEILAAPLADTGGAEFQGAERSRPPRQRNGTLRLNPRFVEWLMGWPLGFTAIDCGLSATEWSRWRSLMRSRYSRLLMSVPGKADTPRKGFLF